MRFVRSVNPAAVQGKPSVAARVWRTLVGRGDVPRLAQPYGIAVGADDTIYVADTNARAIHVFDLRQAGLHPDSRRGQVADWGGIRERPALRDRFHVGPPDLPRPARTGRAGRSGPKNGFLRPTGARRRGPKDSTSSTRWRTAWSPSVRRAASSARSARAALGRAQFNFPTNIARGADGRLYVTDTMNFRVQIFDAKGRFLRNFGQLGDGSGDFDKPKGIAVDSDGHIYVVEGLQRRRADLR